MLKTAWPLYLWRTLCWHIVMMWPDGRFPPHWLAVSAYRYAYDARNLEDHPHAD